MGLPLGRWSMHGGEKDIATSKQRQKRQAHSGGESSTTKVDKCFYYLILYCTVLQSENQTNLIQLFLLRRALITKAWCALGTTTADQSKQNRLTCTAYTTQTYINRRIPGWTCVIRNEPDSARDARCLPYPAQAPCLSQQHGVLSQTTPTTKYRVIQLQ